MECYDNLVQLEDELGAHNYKPLEVVITRGERVWVWDEDGRKYLDCLSAYSAVNQGHCHPRLLKAMVAQSASSADAIMGEASRRSKTIPNTTRAP